MTTTNTTSTRIEKYNLTSELPYRCGACGARFKHPSDCVAHIKTCGQAAYILGAVDAVIQTGN
jgi:hypothetical protein